MTEGAVYDVVIIGGGPAGLSAAQYAARSNLKTIVIDKSPTAGALAFSSRIENYPGVSGSLSGRDLLDIFRKQAIGFGAEYVEERVVGVRFDAEIKEVYVLDGTYEGKTIIIATGAMGRKQTIKGEGEFLGRGVSYCAICDAAFYRGKTVAVIGDSEEAVKEAGFLTRFAELVYLISPSLKLKAEEDHPALKSVNLRVIRGHSLISIEGDEVVKKITMVDDARNESELALSGVFVYLHGSKPIVDFLGSSIELSEEECISTNKSIPGVFAAGDVTCTEVRQVVIAASAGCVAALSAEQYLHHRKRHRYDWAK
jgi:thioredoxin reductase (NADPH)